MAGGGVINNISYSVGNHVRNHAKNSNAKSYDTHIYILYIIYIYLFLSVDLSLYSRASVADGLPCCRRIP